MRRADRSGRNRMAEQIEFPMRVSICAWCDPTVNRGAEKASISHGICPRHLKQFKLGLRQGASAATPRSKGRSRRRSMDGEPVLPLQFAAV